jgi:(p)ppGpp synthase/HD superfamily hydrolase
VNLNNPAAVETFVHHAHAGQTDKIGIPYVEHVLAVAQGLEPFGPELYMAGLLHDVLEDTAYTALDLLHAGVPERTVQAVVAVTNTPGETYQEKIRKITGNTDAVLVKIADNAHNSRSDRAAQLPLEKRERLAMQYANARKLLWSAARPEDVHTIVSIVNPELLEVADGQ